MEFFFRDRVFFFLMTFVLLVNEISFSNLWLRVLLETVVSYSEFDFEFLGIT
jgi:hypothetical protein